MHEPVENRIGERGILQPRMPVFERQLAGDHSRARTDTIIKYFQQIVARCLVEILQAPVVEDQHFNLRELRELAREAAIAVCYFQFERASEPRLARARGAGQDQVLRIAHPVAAGEHGDDALVMQHAGVRDHGTTHAQPLTRFAIERRLLTRLPDVPPVLAVWSEVKVHTDGHVVYRKALYSVPFTLVGKQLWLKATDTVVQAFHRHELVATHPRLRKPGDRHTVRDHQPPEAQAWLEHDPQWPRAREGYRPGLPRRHPRDVQQHGA